MNSPNEVPADRPAEGEPPAPERPCYVEAWPLMVFEPPHNHEGRSYPAFAKVIAVHNRNSAGAAFEHFLAEQEEYPQLVLCRLTPEGGLQRVARTYEPTQLIATHRPFQDEAIAVAQAWQMYLAKLTPNNDIPSPLTQGN